MSLSPLYSLTLRTRLPPPPLADERTSLGDERRAFEKERELFQQQQVARRANVLSTDTDALASRRAETVKAILAATAKAREPTAAPELPTHPLAKAICLARQKADGTIDAAGVRFLADFQARLESIRGLIR
jgi:hypothetical protein